MPKEQFIERRIITGLITSSAFIAEIAPSYRVEFFQANAAGVLAAWVMRHYKKYNAAPKQEIETIYNSYLRRDKLSKDDAEDIADILEDLSDSFDETGINIDVLVDETLAYFEERKLLILADDITLNVERGELLEAQASLAEYIPTEKNQVVNTDFFADDPERTRKIFENIPEPIIEYPGKLGDLLNEHMVRGGFVAFLGPEKIGKTWTLMDIGFQAQKNGRNVAFFAAGDMNRDEMELRKYIHIARRSNKPKYCGDVIVPVIDCWRNQTGDCANAPGTSPFADAERYPKKWEAAECLEAFETNPGHTTCRECYGKLNFIGAPWFKIREKVAPLTWKDGYHLERKFMKKMRGKTWQFMGTSADNLTPRMMHNQLAVWHRQGFDADVILVDYPDIMTVEGNDARMDFRHRENAKWKQLRGMAHDWHALVVAVTQADAIAHSRLWIDLSNFSEDKRKYAHATAFFGLNQTDDEAELGLFRMNQLIVREGKRGKHYATVLQRLETGRPHLGSF